MSTAPQRSNRPITARRRGRTVAGALYYGFIAFLCITATWQITVQTFFLPRTASPYATCHEGLSALESALQRARHAAPGTDGEDRAIERFRAALNPEWKTFDGVADSCRGSNNDKGALDAIERLRYAEEHAARREAGDLAPLRRKVQSIVETDLADRPAPPRLP